MVVPLFLRWWPLQEEPLSFCVRLSAQSITRDWSCDVTCSLTETSRGIECCHEQPVFPPGRVSSGIAPQHFHWELLAYLHTYFHILRFSYSWSTTEELCDVLHRSRQISLPHGDVHWLECRVNLRYPCSLTCTISTLELMRYLGTVELGTTSISPFPRTSANRASGSAMEGNGSLSSPRSELSVLHSDNIGVAVTEYGNI